MYTKGFFIGRTLPRASFERQLATDAPRLWTPEFAVGADVVSWLGSTTISLSNGSAGGLSTGTQRSGQRPRLSEARAEGDVDTMTGAEDTDHHEGVVVGLILLAAAFMAGGVAGFLLAVLVR